MTDQQQQQQQQSMSSPTLIGNNNRLSMAFGGYGQGQHGQLESMINNLPQSSNAIPRMSSTSAFKTHPSMVNINVTSSNSSGNNTPSLHSQQQQQGDDYLGEGGIPNKGVIINILNKFLSRRPAKEDLVQNRVLKSDYKPIPLRYHVIEQLCSRLEKCALEIEGIFRISGSANQIRLFWATFVNDNIDFQPGFNEHNITGALKLYIREQFDPLIPNELWSGFVASQVTANDKQIEIDDLAAFMAKVPADNIKALKRILRMMIIFTRHSKLNKMNAHNMGVVFGPNLFRSKPDSPTVMYEAKVSNECVTKLILNYSTVFPELEVPILGTETNTEDYVEETPAASPSMPQSPGMSPTPLSPKVDSTPAPTFAPKVLSDSLLAPPSSQFASITNQLQAGMQEHRRIQNSPSTSAQQLKDAPRATPSPGPIHPWLADANQHLNTKQSPLAHLKRTDFSMASHLKYILSKSKHFKKEEGWDQFLVLRVVGNLVLANSNKSKAQVAQLGKSKKKEKEQAEGSTRISFVPTYLFVSEKNIIFFDVYKYQMFYILPHERLKDFGLDSVNSGLFSLQDSQNNKTTYFMVPRPKIIELLTRALERGRSIAKLNVKSLPHLQVRKYPMLETSSAQGYGKLPESRPVFEALTARGFTELDVWEGTVDLLEIVKQYKSILLPIDTKAVVEFLLPSTDDFKGVYRKSYKLDISTPVFKIICLICEKVSSNLNAHQVCAAHA
ncbi:hypothetical protein SAMD00019534_044600 [Acytostelium subglobosum LB1]|uniref:hypothetical protein n=1 Tax=Acytostelium subglobosum LB1 TaxID=1410327 RepID=UPI000644D548|nr:hypothetical protein SAMD00019534_044600 [Acytostelium subglobosum LB1]GAM21285.1 hypothetical protein SAMD00019534_044600 [Acytostelium subglobosum LB1]|eukprot:XP_012755404.1 hypothetical protein SAMD00019534_044600 [Acytostelium subglobosum LB1]